MFYQLVLFFAKIYTYLVSRGFAHIGNNVIIKPVLNVMNKDKIYFGDNINVGIFSWVSVSTHFGKGVDTSKNRIRLKIGNNVSIGNNAFIVANNDISIGDNSILAPYVYISDHIHRYDNILAHLKDQPLTQNGFVHIGDDVFIGIRACIMPNVTIGDHAVIGANSVVTKDVPSQTVVVGNPAKIIKKFDKKFGKWVKFK